MKRCSRGVTLFKKILGFYVARSLIKKECTGNGAGGARSLVSLWEVLGFYVALIHRQLEWRQLGVAGAGTTSQKVLGFYVARRLEKIDRSWCVGRYSHF